MVFRISSYPSNYTNYNLIKDNNITNNTYGIYFWSSSNNRVLNNTLSENQESAVHFNSYSDSNAIENNTISKNKLGISYGGCYSAGCSNGQSTKILNNTILNNLQGINLGTAKFATVSNNTIAENQELGILVDSGQHTISNNTISGNSIGLQISGTGNTIKDNTFIGGGVFVEAERNYYLYNNEFSNNFVNGKPLVYLKDARDVEITEAGQVFVLNSRNITIKDLNLIGTMTGVVLWHTSYSRVENCTISAKKYGIILEAYNLGYTNNTTIANSTISNSEYGIYIQNSDYNEIFNSTIRDNTRGVYFTSSNYNNITESRILWNQFGVCFDKATANNTVSGSEISNNSDSGVYLITDQYHVCINNTITNNLISNNAKGIYPDGYSSYTNISGNVIVGNSYGFYIDNQNSRFHIVYNNLFNNTNNVYLYSSWTVKWNTTLQEGTNILGGNWLGGNAWLKPDGKGFSQTCIDAQEPIGICDEVYALNDYNKDYLPLKYPMPDLIVESISFVPEQPVLGQIATIKATIKNIGKANANNFNVSFFVNDNLLEKVTIESLKASESISAEIDWTPSSAGSYTIKVIVDSDNNVIESNEENNEKNIEVLIQTTKLTISIYDENDAQVEAKIQLGEEIRFANATIFSLEEGTYELRIEKEGYIPVFANLSIKQGESKSITVKLYREENLTTPRAIMVEGTIEELNELISKVEEEFQNPNAVKNATKTFNLTITNERSLLAVSMPIYKSNESASFFAFLEKISAENASIATENFTAYITPNGKEIKLKFEGRKLGDVNNDGKVSIVDALFIAQYLVGKRTLDNASITYANVNKDAKLSIVDALFIAQYLVGKRNAVFN
ncbi:MAG: right-handed parallel beta-helix repeat-containing protein [Archaeoglobaceae archaeon]